MIETETPPAVAITPGRRARRGWSHLAFPLAVAAAIALGFLVRAFYVLSEDFPLNDGGLFYVMVRDLQQARYRLPAVTSYNAADIPFAYPPLGFYVAGLLDDLTPLGLFDIFRLLPLVATSLTIVAVFLLAREMLPNRFAIIVATFAFALIPRGFIWLLMGGGVTRALGLLFAVLALWQISLVYTRRQVRFVPTAALCAGLTILSHLETAQFLAIGSALLFLAYGRHRRGLAHSALVAAGAAMIAAPWWGSVVAQHGLAPFLAARETGPSIFTDTRTRNAAFYILARFGDAGEPFFPLARMVALLGALAILADTIAAAARRWFVFPLLPAWWAAIILLDIRAAYTYMTIPVALLAGVGVARILAPLPFHSPDSSPPPSEATLQPGGPGKRPPWSADRGRIWIVVLVGFLLCYATVAAVLGKRPQVHGEAGVLVGLSREERAAMRWVAGATPPDSRFLVLAGGPWPIDKTAEWFPALALRPSVTTVQGTEWLPGKAHARREAIDTQAQECADRDTSCLDRWVAETGSGFTHVYVRLPDPSSKRAADHCCAIAAALAADPRFALLYAGPGALIFARR